jgi:hypothetical protein
LAKSAEEHSPVPRLGVATEVGLMVFGPAIYLVVSEGWVK